MQQKLLGSFFPAKNKLKLGCANSLTTAIDQLENSEFTGEELLWDSSRTKAIMDIPAITPADFVRLRNIAQLNKKLPSACF